MALLQNSPAEFAGLFYFNQLAFSQLANSYFKKFVQRNLLFETELNKQDLIN
jgi:hypothetical protein